MNLTKEKERIKAWVDSADEETIDLLNQIREGEHEASDWWDELTEEQKAQIAEGQKDVDEGRTISHAKVLRKFNFQNQTM